MHAHNELITSLYHRLVGSCDDIPLSSFVFLSRPFWDSPAICSSLFLATSVQGGLEEDANELENAITQAVAELKWFKPDSKIQGTVYNLIRSRFHACDLISTMQRRCSKYFSIDACSIDFLQVFSVANALGSQDGFSMLKTVLGAWITNRRIQAESRP